MSDQDLIKQAVDETIAEMNEKIRELNSYKKASTHDNDQFVDDIILYINNEVSKVRKYYDEFKNSNDINTTVANVKNIGREMYESTSQKLSQLPDYHEIVDMIKINTDKFEKVVVNSDEFNKINDNLVKIKENPKVINAMNKLNENTDKVLYVVRDVYDEVVANEKVQDLVKKTKNASIDLLNQIKDQLSDKK